MNHWLTPFVCRNVCVFRTRESGCRCSRFWLHVCWPLNPSGWDSQFDLKSSWIHLCKRKYWWSRLPSLSCSLSLWAVPVVWTVFRRSKERSHPHQYNVLLFSWSLHVLRFSSFSLTVHRPLTHRLHTDRRRLVEAFHGDVFGRRFCSSLLNNFRLLFFTPGTHTDSFHFFPFYPLLFFLASTWLSFTCSLSRGPLVPLGIKLRHMRRLRNCPPSDVSIIRLLLRLQVGETEDPLLSLRMRHATDDLSMSCDPRKTPCIISWGQEDRKSMHFFSAQHSTSFSDRNFHINNNFPCCCWKRWLLWSSEKERRRELHSGLWIRDLSDDGTTRRKGLWNRLLLNLCSIFSIRLETRTDIHRSINDPLFPSFYMSFTRPKDPFKRRVWCCKTVKQWVREGGKPYHRKRDEGIITKVSHFTCVQLPLFLLLLLVRRCIISNSKACSFM